LPGDLLLRHRATLLPSEATPIVPQNLPTSRPELDPLGSHLFASQALQAHPLFPASTSLEPPETSIADRVRQRSGSDLHPCADSIFRHTGWKRDRERVYEALKRVGSTADRLWNFCQCGHGAYVLRDPQDPDHYRISGCTCHDRFCLPCANSRSQTIALNVLEKLADNEARFITLTLHSTHEPLGQLLAHLTRSFTKLRAKKLWRKACYGGVSFIEVKWVPHLERWNVHLHVLAYGRYLKQGLLSQAWHKVTGTSYIADIRFVKNHKQVARYVSKYASKPLDSSVLHEPERLDEAIVALKGKRLCATFGNWRGLDLTDSPSEESWDRICTLSELIANALAGDPTAIAIAEKLGIPDVFPLPQPRPPPVPREPLFPPIINNADPYAGFWDCGRNSQWD